MNFLKIVPLLSTLPSTLLAKVSDVLELEVYKKGDYIVREGTSGKYWGIYFLKNNSPPPFHRKMFPSMIEIFAWNNKRFFFSLNWEKICDFFGRNDFKWDKTIGWFYSYNFPEVFQNQGFGSKVRLYYLEGFSDSKNM